MTKRIARGLLCGLAATFGVFFLNNANLEAGSPCWDGSCGHHAHGEFGYGYGYAAAVRLPIGGVSSPVSRIRLRPVTPPPGTLGRTYKQPSRSIPPDLHPRIGMLEIIGAPAALEVAVVNIDGIRGDVMESLPSDDGVWTFQSDAPLIPGRPQIYKVTLRTIVDGKIADDVRYIRLIPGRVVRLDYSH